MTETARQVLSDLSTGTPVIFHPNSRIGNCVERLRGLGILTDIPHETIPAMRVAVYPTAAIVKPETTVKTNKSKTTSNWEVCQPKYAEAWAIIDKDNQYYCQQDDESWWQNDCKGWAICSVDRDYVKNLKSTLRLPGFLVPMRLVQS